MNILIVINNSFQVDNTLAFCAQIAVKAGEEPTVLTVVGHRNEQLITEAKELHRYIREVLDFPDLITKVRVGHPVREISLEVKDNNYDLVILREEHASFIGRLLVETTATHVAEQVACSTIVVKGIARPIQRILLCDSCAGKSSVLSRFTAQLADLFAFEEEVTILHVMSQMSAGPGVPGKQLRASVEELIAEHTPEGMFLGKDIQVLEKPGIHAIPKVRHGLIVDEILDEARAGDYDLIVIGAHNGERWHRYMLDDIARKILIRSDRTTLIIK